MSTHRDDGHTPGGTLVAPMPSGRLACVLDYLAFVAKNRPLVVLLDEAPRRIAECIDADVASLYLLEGDGQALVMRGCSGLPPSAPGRVRLELGQGITGMAVRLRHPIAVDRVTDHAYNRDFPELDEARFPALLAVPVLGTAGPLGAVVVQRKQPFSEEEVSLLCALTAPISSALRLARLLDDLRESSPRKTGSGTRKVTLPGIPLVRGRALGAIAAARRPATGRGLGGEEARGRLRQALDQVEQELTALAEEGNADERAFVDSYLLMCRDQQLRRTAFDHLDEGKGLAEALGLVARHALRAASDNDDPFLIERARDLEHLCDTLMMMATPDSRAAIPAKAIVVSESLSIYDLMITARAQPTGLVLTETELRPRSRVLVDRLNIPAIADVRGAFRWLSPGDIALLDADHGLLTINPTRADIAAYRADRRRERQSQPGEIRNVSR